MAWLPFGLTKLLLDLNCRMIDQLPITSVTELWITINPENLNKDSYKITKCLFYQLKTRDLLSIDYILLHVLFSKEAY